VEHGEKLWKGFEKEVGQKTASIPGTFPTEVDDRGAPKSLLSHRPGFDCVTPRISAVPDTYRINSCQKLSVFVAPAQRIPSHANRHRQCLDVMSGTKTESRRLTQAAKRVVPHKLVQVPADFDYVVSGCSDSERNLATLWMEREKLGANALREQSYWFCARCSFTSSDAVNR